jgi:hypothetical protein
MNSFSTIGGSSWARGSLSNQRWIGDLNKFKFIASWTSNSTAKLNPQPVSDSETVVDWDPDPKS